MEKHEEKLCPKCGIKFTCKMGDVINCQCNTVTMSEASKLFLSKTNFDCLCKDCLTKMNNDINSESHNIFPT